MPKSINDKFWKCDQTTKNSQYKFKKKMLKDSGPIFQFYLFWKRYVLKQTDLF